MKTRTRWAFAAILVLLLAGGYVANASIATGAAKRVTVVAGADPDGTMYFRCLPEESTPGVCDPARPGRITVDRRDRVTLTVRTDDGRPHSHDFRVEGFAYGPPFPWIEMELREPSEATTFTAWKAGEFRFVCELRGHEAAGMWGVLVVRGKG